MVVVTDRRQEPRMDVSVVLIGAEEANLDVALIDNAGHEKFVRPRKVRSRFDVFRCFSMFFDVFDVFRCFRQV